MIQLINPQHSFVQFNAEGIKPHCIFGDLDFCLPVYEDDDVYFQFVISGTQDEIDSLCQKDAGEIDVMLISECDGTPLLLFDEKPQRIRLSTTQLLYYWNHGLPDFQTYITFGQCFKIQIILTESAYSESYTFCSNCFERIKDDCFTSVIEYSSDTDAFGFKYCQGGDMEDNTEAGCDPLIIPFIDRSTLTVPYTSGLRAKYGTFPSVQVWIYDGSGNLVNMGIQVQFDAYPPNSFTADFGGNSSGIIIIR